MKSVFSGTIFEPYDFLEDVSHVIVVHANPVITESPALNGARLSREQMQELSAQSAELICACLEPGMLLRRLPIEGFLIFALGIALEAPPDGQTEARLLRQLSGQLENALLLIRQQLQLSLHLSVSALHANTQNVYDAYREAFSIAVHAPFFTHTGAVLLYGEFQDGLSAEASQEKQLLEKQWHGLMEARNYEQAERVLRQILELRRSAPVTVTSLTQELISRMEFCAYQLCDVTELANGMQEDLLRKIQLIRSVKTVEELYAQVGRIYRAFAQIAQGGSHRKDASWARKIALFIQHNYADKNLNAAMLSQRFGLAPAYISHIFHKSTGTKLLDYIHLTRIEHIQHLLRDTNLSLTAIAERTGYFDRYSMSRVFRRYVGVTPSDYRRA